MRQPTIRAAMARGALRSNSRRGVLAVLLALSVGSAWASTLTTRLGLCVPTAHDPPGWGTNCINPSLTLLDGALMQAVAGTITAPQTCGAGCTIQGVSGGQVIATKLSTNPSNCPTGYYPTGIDEYGAVEGCSALLAALTIPTGALPVIRNASGSTQLYQVPDGSKKLHVMDAWVSSYNYDTNAANNVTATPACNGKTWVQGVSGDETATSTLSITLSDTSTCPTLTSVTGFEPSSALTGTNAILLDREWVIFAGISGNQLTPCTRGAQGSTATTHTAGIAATEYKERRLSDIWAAALTNACTDADCTASKTPCSCCTGNGASSCVGAASSVPSTNSVPVIDVPIIPNGVVMCTLAGSSAAKCHVACGFNGYVDP
jgi:hypothetical protein